MYTELVLAKLGVEYSTILKKKHGSAREFSYGEVINRILLNKACSAHALFPEIGQQTFNRMIKKAFPSVKLNGGNETWQYYLLTLIEHKLCGTCSTVKHFSDFSKDSSKSGLGIASCCKRCRVLMNATQYKTETTKEAHQRSYEKNYGKIRDRQNRYKGERSLRVPPWSQTELISEYYEKCPEGFQVDHLLPLKGELVSGLHVIENLQYLTKEDNLKKGNKFLIT